MASSSARRKVNPRRSASLLNLAQISGGTPEIDVVMMGQRRCSCGMFSLGGGKPFPAAIPDAWQWRYGAIRSNCEIKGSCISLTCDCSPLQPSGRDSVPLFLMALSYPAHRQDEGSAPVVR